MRRQSAVESPRVDVVGDAVLDALVSPGVSVYSTPEVGLQRRQVGLPRGNPGPLCGRPVGLPTETVVSSR